MALDEDSTWILALETALLDSVDFAELISITRGRVLPEEHRAQIWYTCLGGGTKINNFVQFDEMFDLPEQSLIRADCRALVNKLGNDEEDKVSVVSDVESIFTHYCKTRHLRYSNDLGWSDILTPLLAVKMPRDHIYMCFEEILEKYVPRETCRGSPFYHLLRLLILYHDPQLTTFLDSRKITPDLFGKAWVEGLFSSVCSLDATLSLWDIYLQERDPFFILFLSLVVLVNARDQIMNMANDSREDIIKKISLMPAALTVDDVSDFCSLARYYIIKTPATFKEEFATVIFGSVYMGRTDDPKQVGNLPLSQALCLPVSASEIIEANQMPPEVCVDSEQVAFFLVDCRPPEQYNAGHLPNAFHLDSNLMLQQPSSFQTAVQGLLMAQRQAVAADTPGCGQHLCFIGSGREQEDQYVHMVVASFLQRSTAYVSLAKGGFQALHDQFICNLNENLSDHDAKNCIVCSPDSLSNASDTIEDNDDFVSEAKPQYSNQPQTPSTFMNKFSSFSTAFKSKSAEMKGKLVEYITNPNGETATVERHVSASDRTRKLYRNQGDIFTLEDHDDMKSDDSHNNDQMEIVKMDFWQKDPDFVKKFSCRQVTENNYTYPVQLILMETLLFVIREIEGRPGEGYLTARRSLLSIVKITSKKKQQNLITLKYGKVLPDEDITINDMDRFLIPDAKEATRVIKDLIMNQIEKGKS